MPDIDAARLSELIGLIYDCAIDPARWPAAMEAIRVELGLHNSSLDLIALPHGEGLLNYMTNIPEPYASDMLQYVGEVPVVWGGADRLATLPIDQPAVLSRVVGEPDETWTSPLYTEWSKPQGICDVLAIFVARDAGAFGALGFGRHRDGAPIDDRMLAVARLLIPHLQRAAAINRLLDLAALREASFAALFDTLAAPILLVGRELKIVHANAAAVRLLAKDGALRSRDGVLAATDRGAQAALAAAVAQAADAGTAIGRMGLGIPLPDADGDPRALHVLPLRDGTLGAEACAALFIADRAKLPTAPGPVVERLFGLTPAEHAVFAEIVAGRRVQEAARSLGIAPSTVRTHLLRLYDKTGTRRQAELVRLAADLASPAVMH